MPIFSYSASDTAGTIQKGQMEATDKKTVIDYLKSEKLLVITVKEKSGGKNLSFSKKIGYLDKISFTGNLATMSHAGVNLTEALDVISTETKNEHFQNILNDLKFSIENGKPLSAGLAHYPNDFDPIFINIAEKML